MRAVPWTRQAHTEVNRGEPERDERSKMVHSERVCSPLCRTGITVVSTTGGEGLGSAPEAPGAVCSARKRASAASEAGQVMTGNRGCLSGERSWTNEQNQFTITTIMTACCYVSRCCLKFISSQTDAMPPGGSILDAHL